MRNKSPLFALLVFMLTLVWGQGLAGKEHGTPLAGDRPAALQQDGSDANRPPSDVKPGTPLQNQAPRKPKAPGASDDLEPFKPSEEIEADRAVDFPYDI